LLFGIFIAVGIIGLILFFYTQISHYKASEDEADLTKSKETFNAAFLAYDASLMYGTDVLSCLNKAQNNNQKYVYNNYYGTDNLESSARQEYFINVKVTLHKTIEEQIKVYYTDSKGKLSEIASGATLSLEDVNALKIKESTNYNVGDSIWLIHNYKNQQMFSKNKNSKTSFFIPNVTYYYFESTGGSTGTSTVYGGKFLSADKSYANVMWGSNAKLNGTTTIRINSGLPKVSGSNLSLQSCTIQTAMTGSTAGVEYQLLGDSANKTEVLSALLSTVTDTEQTIKNNVTATSYTHIDWSSATWKTAAYDFKTRKFKCTGITYDDTTGYITEICFEEITNY
jgi:hypothetical protein